MDNFTFCTPTEFIFGKHTQMHTGQTVLKYHRGGILLVSGGNSARRSGLLPAIEGQLKELGIPFENLEGISANPEADKVYEGIGLMRSHGLGFLLAVGGGSVIDTAKAIALGVPYNGDFWDFYTGAATPEKALGIGVVLTIPAAGSEGSGNSVITREDSRGRHKISVRYPEILRPRFAIMNPELTFTLPPFQSACGAVDIIGHIMERYFSNTPGCETTDAISESLMRTVMMCGKKICGEPYDYDARANIMWAGMLAHNGLCGVGKEEDWASHRLEHEISAYYNVAHGAGLAVIYPAWLKFVAAKNPGKAELFARNVMGIDKASFTRKETIDAGIEALKDFYHSLGLTTSLRELINMEPDIELLVKSLRNNIGERLGNYVPLTMEDCAEIYKLAL